MIINRSVLPSSLSLPMVVEVIAVSVASLRFLPPYHYGHSYDVEDQNKNDALDYHVDFLGRFVECWKCQQLVYEKWDSKGLREPRT